MIFRFCCGGDQIFSDLLSWKYEFRHLVLPFHPFSEASIISSESSSERPVTRFLWHISGRDGIKVRSNFDCTIGLSLLSSSQSLYFHEIDVAMRENLRASVFIWVDPQRSQLPTFSHKKLWATAITVITAAPRTQKIQ
jgi:hypothetical protein